MYYVNTSWKHTYIILTPVNPTFYSEEANWSGSALFAIQYVNLYQQAGSSYLIILQLEVGVSS